jgi:uncharacterized membrane protein
MLLRKLRIWLLAGLVVLLPIWLTVFTVVWLFEHVDSAIAAPIRAYVGVPLPGVGIVFALLLTLLVGWLTTHIMGQQLVQFGERTILRIPLVRVLYGGVKQVIEAVFSAKEQAFSRVALIEFPRKGIFCLGFVVGELPGTNLVRVWVPPGPSPTAGPVLLIPQEELVILPMTVEDGLKLVVSAGVLTPRDSDCQALAKAALALQGPRA